jgi:hypothetical protein
VDGEFEMSPQSLGITYKMHAALGTAKQINKETHINRPEKSRKVVNNDLLAKHKFTSLRH